MLACELVGVGSMATYGLVPAVYGWCVLVMVWCVLSMVCCALVMVWCIFANDRRRTWDGISQVRDRNAGRRRAAASTGGPRRVGETGG